jgi:lysophospholipase L1-like esterase
VQKTQTEATPYRHVRRSELTKIVALGDSLTLGETGFGLSLVEPVIAFPAYLGTLAEEYLRTRHSNLVVQVVNKGVNGDLTSGMFERFPSDVADQRADYVIVLGGTNDIGWGLDLARIIHNLTSIYDAANRDGIGAVACSVPSLLGFDELIPPRLDLNRAMRKEAEKRKIPFLDLFTATADATENRLLEDYSSDGLHLNSKGYERIGKYIFDEWLKIVLDRALGSDT